MVVTKAASLAVYDPDLTPTRAVLAQPLACVLFAVERIGDVRGRACAVLGLGPIGLLFAHVLAERGAARVVGVDPVDRRSVAGQFGLDHVVARTSREWAAALPEADRPDVVVEAVGHQVATFNDALHAARTQGSVFYFGVPDSPIYPIEMASVMRKNLTLRGGVTPDRRRVLVAAGNYLAGPAPETRR